MIVDANLLLYAIDSDSPHHAKSAAWLSSALNGNERVGLPWQTIGAFLRIATHPRASLIPLSADEAWAYMETWLARRVVWIPPATESTALVYRNLNSSTPATGNLVTDAMLAAIAIENGEELHSADGDFSRFSGLRWTNPLR